MEELLFLVKHVLAVTKFDSPKTSQKDNDSIGILFGDTRYVLSNETYVCTRAAR